MSVNVHLLSVRLQGSAGTTFDVSVYNHVAVQVGHALQDLSRVLPGDVFRQRPVGLQLIFHRTLVERKRSLYTGLFENMRQHETA